MKSLLIPTFTIAFLLGNMALSDNYDDNFATMITFDIASSYSMDFDGEKTAGEDFLDSQNAIF
ncbi:hypothetical protein [Candidatus Coxiella mudrowiae]|uniref:hypothetical protein n=1 Tax=Candidatus Coxiella mudrowiae TaxID=2054173 RepID=UPI001FD03010|nr:hypothetical protein [Candidatus Coxiella mudrowiae]